MHYYICIDLQGLNRIEVGIHELLIFYYADVKENSLNEVVMICVSPSVLSPVLLSTCMCN